MVEIGVEVFAPFTLEGYVWQFIYIKLTANQQKV